MSRRCSIPAQRADEPPALKGGQRKRQGLEKKGKRLGGGGREARAERKEKGRRAGGGGGEAARAGKEAARVAPVSLRQRRDS